MKKEIHWPPHKAGILLMGAFFLGLGVKWPLLVIVGIVLNFIGNFLIDDLPEKSITSPSDGAQTTAP